MVELGAIGLGVALGERVGERRGCRAALVQTPEPRFDGTIVDPKRAIRAEQLDPLVIAVAGASAVADHAQHAARALENELRRIDVAKLADLRIDQASACREELDELLSEQPARRVEIVDGEVLEQAAAARNEVRGRGTPGHD